MTDELIIQGDKGGCFPAATKILTPTGYKKISEIRKGDIVVAYNTDNVLADCVVTQTHKHKVKDLRGDAILCVIHKDGNLKATANHWFYTPQKTYKELGDFLPGEFLVDTKGRSVEILDIIKMPDEKYVYNLTVEPYNTFIVEGIRVHNKGGGKGGGATYVPVEDANSLQSKAIVRVVDLLGEGEIEGLVDGDDSIYVDEVALSNGGTYNFSGVTTYERTGTTDQTYIPGFTDVAPNVIDVSTEVTYASGGIIQATSDAYVDDVRVVVSVPSLMQSMDNGDLKATTVEMVVDVQPDGGAWNSAVKTITIQGKCTSTYQRDVRITNLAQYGAGPWNIRVRRTTADSGSAKLINETWFSQLVEIKNRKITYRDSAIVGVQVDAQQFGSNVPRRAYDVKGLKIQVPDNRTYSSTYDTASYSGAWGGTFKTEWCDNPAWVLYDVLTNDRYGLGLDGSYVDKWALYTIGAYCDVQVSDGTPASGTERRFTFNGVIQSTAEAYHIIGLICSSMRVMPYWSSGLATFTQDSPKDASRIVSEANVENGLFNYSSTALKDRHTAARVTWNDPDDFCRQSVEIVEDDTGVERYGYNPIDVVAFGCTSRGQAYRFGKWILESELNEIETVRYVAGLDHMDCVPGEIIDLVDPSFSSSNRFGGRTVSGTTTSITIDNAIDLEAGETYTVSILTSSGSITEKTLTNSIPSSDVTVLTWAGATEAPAAGSMWVVTASNLEPRQFRVVSVKELAPNKYEINAIQHDSTKFARVEQNIYLNDPVYINIPEDELSPPTTIDVEAYTYLSDENNNRQYGVMVSWIASTDPRTVYYEVQYKPDYAPYQFAGDTSSTSYDIKPLSSGTYNFRVRGVSLTQKSAWLTYSDYNVITYSGLGAPTNIVSMGLGNTTFSGADCGITWTAPSGAYYNDFEVSSDGFIKDYKVETCQTDGTLLHTDFVVDTSYIYTYDNNKNDNRRVDGGSAQRSLMFKVYARDIYDTLSAYATETITNPAPSMAGLSPDITAVFAGLKVDWSDITPVDTDGSKFIIYCDTSATPTTAVAEVGWETRYLLLAGLSTEDTYYVQIEPYDLFGVGTKSSIDQGDPLKVSEIDIDAELSSSITITTSETTVSGDLPKLYDRNVSSSGVAFTGASTEDWVDYDFGIEYFIDRVSVWSAGAANVYVAYASNDEVWHYLRGEADHTLDADGELVAASNQADAQTNYWTLAAGKNVAIFPQGIIARNCRLYIKSNQTIYELVFGREVIAEFVVADNLAAISADLGTISAGTIQSPTYPASGLFIDVTTGDIIGKVTFSANSSGYNNITDKPTLGDLADNDTVGATDCDTTIIDGGKIITGLLTASNIQTGTLSTGYVTVSSTDGKTTMTGNTLTIKDASNVTRVKIGKLT